MQLVALSSSEQFSSDQISSHANQRSYSLRGSVTSSALRDETGFVAEGGECNNWAYYHKPITITVIGVLGLLVGVVLTILYFTRMVEVPYVLGPICLSIGLMFMVTGLVWLQVIKEKIKHQGLIRILQARQPAP